MKPYLNTINKPLIEAMEIASFLSFMDAQIEIHPGLIAPANEAQLDRVAQLLINVKD